MYINLFPIFGLLLLLKWIWFYVDHVDCRWIVWWKYSLHNFQWSWKVLFLFNVVLFLAGRKYALFWDVSPIPIWQPCYETNLYQSRIVLCTVKFFLCSMGNCISCKNSIAWWKYELGKDTVCLNFFFFCLVNSCYFVADSQSFPLFHTWAVFLGCFIEGVHLGLTSQHVNVFLILTTHPLESTSCVFFFSI